MRELKAAEETTARNRGMLFNIALNYGGRAEIVDAAAASSRLRAGLPADELDEQRFGRFLYTAGQPDPDLLIRTSGEMRVSNFLLWQIAYAEIWVTDTLWPDFRKRDLLEAILAYQKRDRRYGGINQPAVGGRMTNTAFGVRSGRDDDARPERPRAPASRRSLVPASSHATLALALIAAALAFVEYTDDRSGARRSYSARRLRARPCSRRVPRSAAPTCPQRS